MLIQSLTEAILFLFAIQIGRLRERRGYWLFQGKTWTFDCPDCTVVIKSTDQKLLGDLMKTHELGHLAERQ